MRAVLVAILLLSACKKGPADEGVAYDGPLDMGPANPYPNHLLVDTDGKLALPDGLAGDNPTPDLARTTWRTGFSPSQTAVLQLPGIRPDDLPAWWDVRVGEGSVKLVDLDTSTVLPVMAELDAHPDADEPALLIRPLHVLPMGHRIGIAVTTDAVDRPKAFDALLKGAGPSGDRALAEHTQDLVSELAAATGIAEGDIAVAWDFPVDDPSRPLRSALEQYAVSGSYELPFVRRWDNGDRVVPSTWAAASGSFEVTDFLVDDRTLDLAGDGSVTPTGTVDAELYVHVPRSVSDAPAGSVPVMVFGHGIFSSPERYLDEDDDPSGVLALAEEGGFIVVGTTWRGLTSDDVVEVVEAANDFALFPQVPERLVQGQVNTRTLVDMVDRGDLFDHPIFIGESGQLLPELGRVYYYGISLGGIEGAVLFANGAPIDAAAFHVGGSMWSTMLERSSNWTTFEALMISAVPEPADRQLLYSVSQLWWDAADPATYAAELTEMPMLYQYSLGDEQVPNLSTEALARSIGLPLLEPADHVPYGFAPVSGPLGPGSRALVQFDPERTWPVQENRPAEVTGAHGAPRMWAGARAQVIDHLTPGAEGSVVHHCGGAVCSESNSGI